MCTHGGVHMAEQYALIIIQGIQNEHTPVFTKMERACKDQYFALDEPIIPWRN